MWQKFGLNQENSSQCCLGTLSALTFKHWNACPSKLLHLSKHSCSSAYWTCICTFVNIVFRDSCQWISKPLGHRIEQYSLNRLTVQRKIQPILYNPDYQGSIKGQAHSQHHMIFFCGFVMTYSKIKVCTFLYAESLPKIFQFIDHILFKINHFQPMQSANCDYTQW